VINIPGVYQNLFTKMLADSKYTRESRHIGVFITRESRLADEFTTRDSRIPNVFAIDE
jgi:hypothetical protein